MTVQKKEWKYLQKINQDLMINKNFDLIYASPHRKCLVFANKNYVNLVNQNISKDIVSDHMFKQMNKKGLITNN